MFLQRRGEGGRKEGRGGEKKRARTTKCPKDVAVLGWLPAQEKKNKRAPRRKKCTVTAVVAHTPVALQCCMMLSCREQREEDRGRGRKEISESLEATAHSVVEIWQGLQAHIVEVMELDMYVGGKYRSILLQHPFSSLLLFFLRFLHFHHSFVFFFIYTYFKGYDTYCSTFCFTIAQIVLAGYYCTSRFLVVLSGVLGFFFRLRVGGPRLR